METVLIVEDTRSELELISYYLKQNGYSIIHAASAREALDKAIEHQPNVIVTDVIMPGMSGFELCRSLKRNPNTAHVPIVMCSAKDQKIDRFWGLRQGAAAYLAKPFTRAQLVQAVASVSR